MTNCEIADSAWNEKLFTLWVGLLSSTLARREN